MANGAVDLRVNVVLFLPIGRELRLGLFALKFPIKLRHFVDRAKVGFRISVARDAPCHGKLFVLVHDFHLVDPAVTALAANARIDVGGVVEIHVFGQVVDSFPADASPRFPALVNRFQLGAGRMNGGQGGNALVVRRAVAIDTGCRRWNRRVGGFKNGVVAVAAVHF